MMNAHAHPHCPCCGQAVPDLPRLDSVIVGAGLSGQLKQLFVILSASRGRYLSYRDLAQIMFGDREDGGPDNAEGHIRVLVNHLRREIAGYFVKIDTSPGRRGSHARLIWSVETRYGFGVTLTEAAA